VAHPPPPPPRASDPRISFPPLAPPLLQCDMESDRVVPSADGRALAASFGLPFFEVSAKSGSNVQEALHDLVCNILLRAFCLRADPSSSRVFFCDANKFCADHAPHAHATQTASQEDDAFYLGPLLRSVTPHPFVPHSWTC
jgi:hypothetical protein